MAEQKRFGIDGLSKFLSLKWEDWDRIRMTIRPELLNNVGLLTGGATYAMLDYCMGSALWRETSDEESIATVNIAINYVQSAREGDVICTAKVDRRNRRLAVLSGEIVHEDGRQLCTAIGSFTIYPRKDA